MPRVHVIAIGGAHQFAHILPVACELERRHPGQVTFFVCNDEEAARAAAQARALGGAVPAVVVMRLPAAARVLPSKMHKALRLTVWARRLCAASTILCAERTSTMLRKLRADCPPMLHIPHGAGDRAVGFEKRFTLFEQVLVAGRKDRDRLVASGFVAPEACTVTGPIKLSTILADPRPRAPLFDNGLPTILYNPHFSKKHSSIETFGRRLVEAVLRDGRYNLVVAPHVRLARRWSARRRRQLEALAVPGRVVVDTGSVRCNDMTYTLGADLYLGDVSSQVYEFLVHPRPCLFVDARGVDWQESEDYAMWHFGEVIVPAADPIAAIERAFASHSAYAAWQRERMAYTIDGISWALDGTPGFKGRNPVGEAADQVERYAGLAETRQCAA
ncbi:glycosyl transferase [Novosphingobium sp. BL-52-GroH]|uniref:glycosyl transferase n=1 Tax=Novosphingobium sp. BL-52-GroH TaxID=3349877 RepID=UPI00384DFF57